MTTTTIRPEGIVERLDVPVGTVRAAEVQLEFGAGRLDVAAADPGFLLQGRFNPPAHYRLGTEHAYALLRPDPDTWYRFRDWHVRLARAIPTRLRLGGGVSIADLDLSETRVTDLRLGGGVGRQKVVLPTAAGHGHVRIEGGFESLQIVVPAGVAARIHTPSPAPNLISVDEARFPKQRPGHWQSRDYEAAVHRFEIEAEIGFVALTVR